MRCCVELPIFLSISSNYLVTCVVVRSVFNMPRAPTCDWLFRNFWLKVKKEKMQGAELHPSIDPRTAANNTVDRPVCPRRATQSPRWSLLSSPLASSVFPPTSNQFACKMLIYEIGESPTLEMCVSRNEGTHGSFSCCGFPTRCVYVYHLFSHVSHCAFPRGASMRFMHSACVAHSHLHQL